MKKRIIIVLAVLLMTVSAQAQIFILEEGAQDNRYVSEDGVGVIVPLHDVEYDQTNYTPLGSGALLLAGLAGAYLLGKKKKK